MSRFLLVDDELAVRAAMLRALRVHDLCAGRDLGGAGSLRDFDEQRAALQTLAEAVRQLVSRTDEDF